MKNVETTSRFRSDIVEECMLCDATSNEKLLTGLRVNGVNPVFFCRKCVLELAVLSEANAAMSDPVLLAKYLGGGSTVH